MYTIEQESIYTPLIVIADGCSDNWVPVECVVEMEHSLFARFVIKINRDELGTIYKVFAEFINDTLGYDISTDFDNYRQISKMDNLYEISGSSVKYYMSFRSRLEKIIEDFPQIHNRPCMHILTLVNFTFRTRRDWVYKGIRLLATSDNSCVPVDPQGVYWKIEKGDNRVMRTYYAIVYYSRGRGSVYIAQATDPEDALRSICFQADLDYSKVQQERMDDESQDNVDGCFSNSYKYPNNVILKLRELGPAGTFGRAFEICGWNDESYVG